MQLRKSKKPAKAVKVEKPVIEEAVLSGLGDAPTNDSIALEAKTEDASTADAVA